MNRILLVALAVLGLAACRPDVKRSVVATDSTAAANTAAQPELQAPATAPRAVLYQPSALPSGAGVPCGPLDCRRFPDAVSAVRAILTLKPRLLAVGEAHALVGREGIPTATERFQNQLLPILATAGASKLLVELVQPPRNCQQETEAVKQVQAPIVAPQQPQNQDRFIQMGSAAQALGVVPFLLEASCADFALVRQAGADGVSALLNLIATKSETLLRKMLAAGTADAWYLAYGGALHNDVDTANPYAFGAALALLTNGRYVALDLIVPEYIKPTPAWQALPWYPHFDPSAAPKEVTLYRTGAESFALIFSFSPVPAASSAPGGDLLDHSQH